MKGFQGVKKTALAAGKLPAAVLRGLLQLRDATDRAVIVGPAYGVDAAVIDLGRCDLLVLKSDPVTFTSSELGWYVVHVNANDVAVMGGRPR